MALASQDIFHLLYERTPVWLAQLRTVSNQEVQRESSPPKDASSLWPIASDTYNPNHNNFSASVFSLLDSTPPGLTSSQSTKPYSSHKTASIHRPQPSASASQAGGPPRTIQRTTSTVFYNGAAQAMLSSMIEDIATAVAVANRSSRRQEFRDITQKLIKASDSCHDAAAQLLRDGKCDAQSSSICSTFQDLFVSSSIELKHEREAYKVGSPQILLSPPTSETVGDMPLPLGQKKIDIPSVHIAHVDDPLPDDADLDDEDDGSSLEDFAISAIRLTSRMR